MDSMNMFKEYQLKSTYLHGSQKSTQKTLSIALNVPEKEWQQMLRKEKLFYCLLTTLKFLLALVLLYIFLLSLSFLSIGFTLISSHAIKASGTIKYVLSNPFAALAVGIIVTAVMQNGTATSSIVVLLVGVGIIPNVKIAIPIIYGSNIGTCVTNSLIALTLANDPDKFKRAFSAATLNDGFNILTTMVLLLLEIVCGQKGFIAYITEKIVDSLPLDDPASLAQINFLSAIVTPVTDVFILLNSTAVDMLSSGNNNIKEVVLKCCETEAFSNILSSKIENFSNNITYEHDVDTSKCIKECSYWCMPLLRIFGESGTGVFWIIFSILSLLFSLFAIVKVFSEIIIGPIAKCVTRALNASFPGKFKWLTQVILFLVSFGLTIIVQSSNIVTATLVPLCALGIVSLQKVYVMTLGSNIGTTVTGILTAFTCPPSSLKKSMQLAFVYTFFNLLGVLFWLPLPVLRLPKLYAVKLGNIVFDYRCFLYAYILMIYFILPLIMLFLALVPYWVGLALIGFPLIVILFAYFSLLILRYMFPNNLPFYLASFNWLSKKISKRKIKPEKIQVSLIIPKIEGDFRDAQQIDDAGCLPLIIRRHNVLNGLIFEANRVSIKDEENSSKLNKKIKL
jgi:solute carrier family 34 (sodium-dependent phosphate cotransporter)